MNSLKQAIYDAALRAGRSPERYLSDTPIDKLVFEVDTALKQRGLVVTKSGAQRELESWNQALDD